MTFWIHRKQDSLQRLKSYSLIKIDYFKNVGWFFFFQIQYYYIFPWSWKSWQSLVAVHLDKQNLQYNKSFTIFKTKYIYINLAGLSVWIQFTQKRLNQSACIWLLATYFNKNILESLCLLENDKRPVQG